MHVYSLAAAWRRVGATLAALTAAVVLTFAPHARADDFGIASFTASLSTTQAGAPVDLTTAFLTTMIDKNGMAEVAGTYKDVTVSLPPGLIGNPTAAPRCSEDRLVNFPSCAVATQVGVLTPQVSWFGSLLPWPVPLYNMEPRRGTTAELAAVVFAPSATLLIRVRSEGDYGLTTEIKDTSGFVPLAGATVSLWGVPADPIHDTERGACLQSTWDPADACPSSEEGQAFLRNPSICGAQKAAEVTMNSWQNQATYVTATADMPDITGCDHLPPVEPEASVQPADRSVGAPSGYDIDLDVPQVDIPNQPATPPLKRVAIEFPNGTAISAGSADGLGACTDAQLHQHDRSAVECPGASKIGTVSITTPYLPDPLQGSVFLGQPRPGDQFRLFMVAEGSGISVRLTGSAVPDAVTGHLQATFNDLPPIAFSHLHVHMKGGPRAVLVNPTSCGTATSTTTVTPYGGGAEVSDQSSFDVTGDCAPKGFSPSLTAGTTNPVAGADTPFVLQVRRADNQQDLKAITVDLPAGLIGKVAGFPLCATAAAAAGTCEESARVGSVSVAVGTGSSPISLPGRAYLTVGEAGAPFGLSFVVPARIGPFDFGTVVVRAKVKVEPFTGALRVETDDMPQIIAGIPLHYRAITVNLDRPGFMRNPTSCAEQQVAASLSAMGGAAAAAVTRFQVAGCGDLKLAPKVKMTLNGAKERKRGGKPGLSFQLTQASGQSNLKTVKVTLPKDVSIALGLPTPCTVAQFTARACPLASKIGDSSVTTPLLGGALEGGVYLVTGDKAQLPRLGVLLDGQVPISLLSRVTASKSRVVTTFTAPDLPISAFKLTLNTKTALAATRSLCERRQRANVAITGASGATKKSTVTVPAQGCPARRSKAKQ